MRSVSASTNASNRSSLLPADPYRDRRFLICRGVMTTTSIPAASTASTTGPSGRSIATRATEWRSSWPTSLRIPAASIVVLDRSTTQPAMSTMHSSLVSVAQSIPPVGATEMSMPSFMSVSSLLQQWGCTRWCRDVHVGRSLIGALRRSAL